MPGAALAAGQAIARLGRLDSLSRAHGSTPTSARSFTDSASFDCHWQCTECGFQVPPVRERAADVYRTLDADLPQDRRPEQPCGGCGRKDTWANLREGGVVEALIEQDEVRQSTDGKRGRGLLRIVAIGLWATAAVLVDRGVTMMVMAPLAIPTVALALHSAYQEYGSGRRARNANAWNHQRHPRGRVRARHTGALTGEGLLRAPLSGRPCLAYELGVRHDIDTDAEPWTWTLLEQRCLATLSVGDTRVSTRPYLALERTIHADKLDAAARDELRKRGIDPTRPGYTLFETIVEPGETMTLREHANVLVLAHPRER